MTQVKFRLAAYTDAAGRYNPSAPRNGNEDNMFVNADLGAPEGSAFFESDKETELTDYGCLLVVADGMGGMNAGEVASEIAINVVKDAFSKETIPHFAIEDSDGREKYLKKIVADADDAIKLHAKSHPECDGMGSTIVLAWLHGGEVSFAWLGDSRIYLFREPEGLRRVSKDHSYVQDLVDNGKITEEEAFTHPYNNVITRSLGDMSKKAVADSSSVKLYKGDILLLNSDGLSGVLHDGEMAEIIRANRETMSACRNALWKAAEDAEWHDNVTAVLCEITAGEESPKDVIRDTVGPDEVKPDEVKEESQKPKKNRWVWILVFTAAFIVLLFFLWLFRAIHQRERELLPFRDTIVEPRRMDYQEIADDQSFIENEDPEEDEPEVNTNARPKSFLPTVLTNRNRPQSSTEDTRTDTVSIDKHVSDTSRESSNKETVTIAKARPSIVSTAVPDSAKQPEGQTITAKEHKDTVSGADDKNENIQEAL